MEYSLAIATLLVGLVYIHVGYPAIMALLARVFPRRKGKDESEKVKLVSMVLCIHNEASRLGARLDNLLSLECPVDREIWVVCDGCEDDSEALARAYGGEVVKVISWPSKRGKAAGLNAALEQVQGDVVVFCDVRQTFESDVVVKFLESLEDEEVGAVSGSLEIAASLAGGGKGMDVYWKLEKKLREWEGIFDASVGCTGAIYAIKRHLYAPIPEDTLLDDVVIPMSIAAKGKRVLFLRDARAFDPQTLAIDHEKRRKLRTLVGNYQMMFRYPNWIVPWRCRIWWQVISHKYLRLAVPWILIAIAVLTIFGIGSPLVKLFAAGQGILYLLGFLGWRFPNLKHKVFTIPSAFLVLQWSCLSALITYLRFRNDFQRVWQKSR
ncbi:glycosyltransferase family 2 protein [Phragmitibacter flavus]|nr:glycosyltransferase family 2 protein [Phragmitibacter flavus]